LNDYHNKDPFDKDRGHGITESHAGQNEHQHEIQPGKVEVSRKADHEAVKEVMGASLKEIKEDIKSNQDTQSRRVGS
jgi:hypothetical protein